MNKLDFTIKVSELGEVKTEKEMNKLTALYKNKAENEKLIIHYIMIRHYTTNREITHVNTMEEMEDLRELYFKEEVMVWFVMITKTSDNRL